MENQFSEELVTGKPRTKINLFLLIFIIVITIILIIIIIVLSVELSNKSKDYKDIKKELNDLKDNYNFQIEENKRIKSQYKSQNNTLNDIFHIFQKVISTTNITHNSINKEDYSKVMEKIKLKIKNYENDRTYDFVTDNIEEFSTGFHVDFETPSRNSTNYYTENEYDDIVYKLSCLFGRNVHINYYDKIPHVSYYCENRDFAFAMGALFNQKYIWDWKKKEDIPNPFFLPDFF